jgi:AraC family transcriptional regulator
MTSMVRNDYADRVARAVREIAAGLDRALDLTSLARAAALSPLHFHRIFRGLVGETPLELHRRLRLERAAWCLIDSETPVTQIAFAAGYETHESFTRAFRARYDASPSELRAQMRRAHLPWAVPSTVRRAAPSGVHFVPAGTAPEPLLAGADAGLDVSIVTMPEKRVLSVAHLGPYGMISDAFARLDRIARSSGVVHAARELVAVYHDDPESTPVAELRSDAGIVTGAEVSVPAGLAELTIPAGTYARAVHVGPYAELADTWARFLGRWLVSSGRCLGQGPMYERYLNTPGEAAPEELRTELYLAVGLQPDEAARADDAQS